MRYLPSGRTPLLVAALVAVAAASSQAAPAASTTASASAKASARVSRASSWKTGSSLAVKQGANARYRGRTQAELKLHQQGVTERQASAKARLEAAKKAKTAADVSLKAKVKARAAAETQLTTAKRNSENANVALKAKAKVRASAQLELSAAKSDQAKLEASAKGSISFDFSLNSKKKRAETRVNNATTKLDRAKQEEAKAKKKAASAQVARDKAAEQVTTTKQDEKAAQNQVEEEKKQTEEAKEAVEETTEELEQVEEELVEPPQPEPTEPVVVSEPPATPPENVFGYEKPVWGCFEGNVMFIEPNSPKLPTDYSVYDVQSRLYACEWDIPTRSFEAGFPGVPDQFEWFAIVYTGMFNVSEAGSYRFRINSDDGTKLHIDGKPVVLNDGQHAPRSVAGNIELSAGDHSLVLEYFQGPRYHIALQVWVTPPGGTERIFSVR